MCGRYALWGVDMIGRRFLVVDPTLGFRSKFNIAPSAANPVIVHAAAGNEARLMQWGRFSSRGALPINIRVESLRENPVPSSIIPIKRCIVPANGFYEWKKEGSRNVPYFLHLREKELFGFAGLWGELVGPDDRTSPAYSILTTRPNSLVGAIHNRMPVILAKDQETTWLSGNRILPEDLESIISPPPADEMQAYPVSSRVNSAREEGQDLTEPVTGWVW
ncbi:MAG: SOS response-associated peptidase [Methanoregulaceae archaeon]